MFFFEIGKELFRLLAYMLPSMLIGLYLANVLGKSGQLERVGAIMSPLSNGAKLPRGCASVLTLCVLNKEAGFSMLGMRVGVIFTLVYFFLQLLKTMVGISAGRLILNTGKSILKIDEIVKDKQFLGWSNLLRSSVIDTLEPFRRILKIVIPSLLIAILLINSGILGRLSLMASPLTHYLGLPLSSCLVIVSGLPSMMVCIVTAGPLLINGGITPMEVIRTLLITSLFHSLYTVLRMSFPINISLFGPKLGGIITGVAGLMELTALPVLAVLLTIN